MKGQGDRCRNERLLVQLYALLDDRLVLGRCTEHGSAFLGDEVRPILRHLIERDWMQALVDSRERRGELVAVPRRMIPDDRIEDASFMLTEEGRKAHRAWCDTS